MSTKRKLSQILDSISSENAKPVDSRLITTKPRPFLTKLASLKRSKEVDKLKSVKSSSDLKNTKYAPWSRDAFLERLSTYRYKNWTVPLDLLEISPVECVKRGWVALPVGGATKENTIQCLSCLRIINVNVGGDTLDEETKAQVQHLMAQKCRERLVSEHGESCPWKAKGSDDKIYVFPVTVGQRGAVLQRYQELRAATTKEFLEACKVNYAPDISKEIAQVRIDGDLLEEWQSKALIIALLGWKLESAVPDGVVLSCIMCFRRAILNRNQDISLVDEHMSYCPLIKCHDEIPAWVEMFEYLKNTSARPELEEPLETSLAVPLSNDDSDRADMKRASRLSKLKEVYFKRQKR